MMCESNAGWIVIAAVAGFLGGFAMGKLFWARIRRRGG